MDNRFSFVRLFIDNDSPICFCAKSYSGMCELFEYWKGIGFKVVCDKPYAGSYLYFYKSRLSSKVSISHDISEYIVVPSIKNPRWLILNKKGVIKNHGAIIKPTSLMARLVWNFAKILNLFNLFTLVFPHRMNVLASSLGREFYNNDELNASILYTGAPGKYQKFTIQYSDSNYMPISFLKIANTVAGINRIKNEKQALKQLDAIQLRSMKIPHLRSIVSNETFYGLVQDNILANERMTTLFLREDELAICELYSNFECKVVKLLEYLSEFDSENLLASSAELDKEGSLESLNGKDIVLTVSHGDYIPWNRFISEGVAKVIDWETFEFRPIFYDVFYFNVHKSVLIEKNSIITAINESTVIMHRMLRSCDKIAQKHIIDVDFYILLILVGMLSHYKKNDTSLDDKFIDEIKNGIYYLQKQ